MLFGPIARESDATDLLGAPGFYYSKNPGDTHAHAVETAQSNWV